MKICGTEYGKARVKIIFNDARPNNFILKIRKKTLPLLPLPLSIVLEHLAAQHVKGKINKWNIN